MALWVIGLWPSKSSSQQQASGLCSRFVAQASGRWVARHRPDACAYGLSHIASIGTAGTALGIRPSAQRTDNRAAIKNLKSQVSIEISNQQVMRNTPHA